MGIVSTIVGMLLIPCLHYPRSHLVFQGLMSFSVGSPLLVSSEHSLRKIHDLQPFPPFLPHTYMGVFFALLTDSDSISRSAYIQGNPYTSVRLVARCRLQWGTLCIYIPTHCFPPIPFISCRQTDRRYPQMYHVYHHAAHSCLTVQSFVDVRVRIAVGTILTHVA